MDTCRYHTPHINTLEHEGYEISEEFEYISAQKVPVCSAPQMQTPGMVTGCAYALEQHNCPAYEADLDLLRKASNNEDTTIEMYRLRLHEGVRAYRVELDGEIVKTYTVHAHGQQAQQLADNCFDDEVERTNAEEEEVESLDEHTSYLQAVLA